MSRRSLIAMAIYAALLGAYFLSMPAERLWSHSPMNHYTLQADAWLSGHLDLPAGPPTYTGRNDFARFEGKDFVSFPPVPAVMMVPFRAAAGRVERVRDGMIFLWIAPIGPVLLFLALERLRGSGRSGRTEKENVWLAVTLALGSVFWFCAIQGSVWFGGHVVAMALSCGFLLASIDLHYPRLAGLLLALAVGTRPTCAFLAPVFLHELWRARSQKEPWWPAALKFAWPAATVLLLLMAHNAARFGDPTEFGHRYLAIRWRDRIDQHGLFSLHYLRNNLIVFFGGVPFRTQQGWQINGHGLALWLTSPAFVWALWPRTRDRLAWFAGAGALLCLATLLCYQNSGWLQFGYRFSNDFAPLIILVIALGRVRLGAPFWGLVAFGVAVNCFGAGTFARAEYRDVYFIDPSQQILVSPNP